MLIEVDKLLGFRIRATDEDIGRIHDLLFDDSTWMVRYVTVDTGNWLPGRQVLLSPLSLKKPNIDEKQISVSLSREQVEQSPPIEEHRPVSRQQEIELHQHYGWPAYWATEAPSTMFGAFAMPGEIAPVTPPEEFPERNEKEGEDSVQEERDPHLRSAREVRGYHIEAEDGGIGHIDDFIIDVGMWWIQSVVVDTRNWLPGKKVVVLPRQITKVDWAERKVFVRMLRDEVKAGPEVEDEVETGRIQHS